MKTRPLVFSALLSLVACDPAARGDRLWKKGDRPGAIAAWASAPELSVEQKQSFARALSQEGRLPEAEALLGSTEDSLLTVDGWVVRGLVLMSRGDPQRAYEAFDAGVKIGDDPALWANRCAARLSSGQPASAICADSLMHAPGDPALLLGLAAASAREGQAEIAERSLGDLLSGDRASPEQRWEAARLLGRLGRWERACGVFSSTAPATDPSESVKRTLEAGNACASAGNFETSRLLLEPLVSTTPMAAFMLGTLALEKALQLTEGGERERWTAHAWRYLRLCEPALSTDSSWHNNVGRLQALEGEQGLAEASFRRALELMPGAPYPALNLAHLYVAQGRAELAVPYLEPLSERDDELGSLVSLELSRFYYTSGDPTKAGAIANRLLDRCTARVDSTCAAEAAYLLSYFAADSSRPEEAISWMQTAVAAGGDRFSKVVRMEPAFNQLLEDYRFRAALGEVSTEASSCAP